MGDISHSNYNSIYIQTTTVSKGPEEGWCGWNTRPAKTATKPSMGVVDSGLHIPELTSSSVASLSGNGWALPPHRSPLLAPFLSLFPSLAYREGPTRLVECFCSAVHMSLWAPGQEVSEAVEISVNVCKGNHWFSGDILNEWLVSQLTTRLKKKKNPEYPKGKRKKDRGRTEPFKRRPAINGKLH